MPTTPSAAEDRQRASRRKLASGVLDVDGPRPWSAWVTSMPHEWFFERPVEKFLLLVIALDIYPGRDSSGATKTALANQLGVSADWVRTLLIRLSTPGPAGRPPLVERLDKDGNVISMTSNMGRSKTRLRLLGSAWKVPELADEPPTGVRGSVAEPPTGVRGSGPAEPPTGVRGSGSNLEPNLELCHELRHELGFGVQYPSLPYPPSPSSNSGADRARNGDGDGGLTPIGMAMVPGVFAADGITAEVVKASAGRWDKAGVGKFVTQALADQHAPQRVRAVALEAAADPTARTPKVIASRLRRAAELVPESPPAETGPVCSTCGKTQPVCNAAATKVPAAARHPFKPVSA